MLSHWNLHGPMIVFIPFLEKLIAGNVSMAAGLVGGVIVVVVLLGVYELLVWACDRLLALIDRRKKDAVYPGTPPPW